MAYYAALASLVQLLDDIIFHDRYPAFLLGKHPVVKSLHQKFTSLEESLQDYSSNGDEVNDRLEGRIRDVAYRAQDIIELEISDQTGLQEINSILEELHKSEQETDSILEKMRWIKERQRSEGSELNWDSLAILEESTSINRTCSEKRMNLRNKYSPLLCFGCFRGKKFNKEYSIKKCSPMSCSASVQTPTNKNIMVGFDEALNIIKDHLCGQSPQLQVISIVGMGGIGKTTLARNTFDDALVAYYFDCRVWVTVSQEYHENKVLQIISESLESLMKELPGGVGGDLKERIYKCLKGRRYLIVIDDIWGTNVWDDVRRISPNDSNGSRIMLTTRLLEVARYANPGFIHEMQFLNEDESWNLLQKKVFEQECCPPELENIGMFIASKCCGLPLAVVVIAGVLSHSKTLHHWENIAGKVHTMLGITDEGINRILSLSYNHLSHQLKACFLYLGSFPEDYEIDIANLVRLWIADGFLKSNDSSKLVEKFGEECLEDLVMRNLVLVTKKRSNGQFKICILHDLVRDFCIRRAFRECFFHVLDMEGHLHPKGIENIRRVNYYGKSVLCNIGTLTRSVNCLSEDFNNTFGLYDIKLLRVFNSKSYYHTRIPNGFFRPLHLKYFSFSTYDFSFVFELRNLQTLILHAWESYNTLPPQIWQMTQLRHLIIPTMIMPSVPMVRDHTPIGKLECLQTLMTVVHCRFPNELIQMIPNVRKLKARCWEPDGSFPKNLVHLEELKISDYRITCDIAFPLTLKKLTLSRCYIRWMNMTMLGSLPNLQVLKLERFSFVGEEWEPTEGEFLRLKFLQFAYLGLKYWQAECTHFPRLEYLRIIECSELEMIPLEIGDIPTLKVIEVLRGNAATTNSAIHIQEDQRNQGNDALQVFINTMGRHHEAFSIQHSASSMCCLMSQYVCSLAVEPKVAHSQHIAVLPCPWEGHAGFSKQFTVCCNDRPCTHILWHL